jgi:hypothetical protein
MLRRNTFGWGLTAVALAGFAFAGCSDDDSDSSDSPYAPLPGNFPGNEVRDNFSADDRAAFSGSHFNGDVEGDDLDYFLNTQDRSMIAVHYEDGAAWFTRKSNSGDFSPFVRVTNPLGDGSSIGQFRVIWLTTRGNADPATRARHGDAIILFRQTAKADPAGNSNDDDTIGLFSAYYDSSLASQEQAFVVDAVTSETLEFRYGFQVLASRVDDDPDANDSGIGAPANVDKPGFVSDSRTGTQDEDGLRMFSRENGQIDINSSGDETTFAWALWGQDPDGDGTGGERMLSKRFPLETAGAYTFSNSTVTLSVPSGVDSTEDVVGDWIAHNGTVLMYVADEGSTGQDDTQLCHYNFGTSTVSSPTVFSEVDVDSGVSSFLPEPENVYGPDHGLAFVVAFFHGSTGFDESTRNSDGDLLCATFDAAAGTQLGVTTEIDPLSTGDQAAYPFGQLSGTSLQTRIARDGSWIAVTFRQNDDDDTANTDDNEGVRLQVYDTSRDLSDATSPLLATALELTANMGDPNEADVFDYKYQVELATGESPDLRRSIQSRLDTMNIVYLQYNDDTPDNKELHHVIFTVTLTTGAVPTATSVDTVIHSTLDLAWDVGFELDDIVGNGLKPVVAYDNGAVDGNNDPTGQVNVAFAAQANNASDAGAANGFEEERLFHYVGGGTVVDLNAATALISEDGPFDTLEWTNTNDVSMHCLSAPRSTQAGAHGGQYAVLAFAQEDVTADSQPWGFVWDKRNQVALGSTKLTTQENVSSVEGGDAGRGFGHLMGVSGSTVGIYFQTDDDTHIYYNEWSPGSGWRGMDLVDNHYYWLWVDEDDDTEFVFDYDGTSNSVDDLSGSAVFYSKELDPGDSERLLVRVRR